MFCIDLFLQAQASRSKSVGHQECPREVQGSFWYYQCHELQPHPVCCSFIFLWPKEWLFCFGSSSRLFYERVRVTQGFLYLPPGVALDKTPSISKKKFCIGHLTLSILNPSSLILTELQKSIISIDSFQKVMVRKDGKERWQERMMTFLPTHSSSYALVSLRTCLPTHSSPYALISPLRLCTNRKNIPHKYLSEIVYLSRHAVCHPRLLQYTARKLSCRLDAIDASLLYGSQSRHQLTRVTGWMTSGHLQYVISSMTKAHFQYAIEYLRKLAQWQRSDRYLPSVCHQVSQQWLNGEGVTDIYPSVCYQYWPEH